MATFLIERNLPGASDLTPEQLRGIAATSNEVVAGLGVAYTWSRSYVAGDKIYCLHETDDADTVRDTPVAAASRPTWWSRWPPSSGPRPRLLTTAGGRA